MISECSGNVKSINKPVELKESKVCQKNECPSSCSLVDRDIQNTQIKNQSLQVSRYTQTSKASYLQFVLEEINVESSEFKLIEEKINQKRQNINNPQKRRGTNTTLDQNYQISTSQQKKIIENKNTESIKEQLKNSKKVKPVPNLIYRSNDLKNMNLKKSKSKNFLLSVNKGKRRKSKSSNNIDLLQPPSFSFFPQKSIEKAVGNSDSFKEKCFNTSIMASPLKRSQKKVNRIDHSQINLINDQQSSSVNKVRLKIPRNTGSMVKALSTARSNKEGLKMKKIPVSSIKKINKNLVSLQRNSKVRPNSSIYKSRNSVYLQSQTNLLRFTSTRKKTVKRLSSRRKKSLINRKRLFQKSVTKQLHLYTKENSSRDKITPEQPQKDYGNVNKLKSEISLTNNPNIDDKIHENDITKKTQPYIYSRHSDINDIVDKINKDLKNNLVYPDNTSSSDLRQSDLTPYNSSYTNLGTVDFNVLGESEEFINAPKEKKNGRKMSLFKLNFARSNSPGFDVGSKIDQIHDNKKTSVPEYLFSPQKSRNALKTFQFDDEGKKRFKRFTVDSHLFKEGIIKVMNSKFLNKNKGASFNESNQNQRKLNFSINMSSNLGVNNSSIIKKFSTMKEVSPKMSKLSEESSYQTSVTIKDGDIIKKTDINRKNTIERSSSLSNYTTSSESTSTENNNRFGGLSERIVKPRNSFMLATSKTLHDDEN